MAVCGFISAVNLNQQCHMGGRRSIGPGLGFGSSVDSNQTISLAFCGSESLGGSLTLRSTHPVKSRSRKNDLPLQVGSCSRYYSICYFIELLRL